jgi:hypothetical protein
MKKIKVTVYGGWTSYNYMKQNKKPLAIALNGVGRRLRRGNVANVQYKSNWNCHYKSPHIINIS